MTVAMWLWVIGFETLVLAFSAALTIGIMALWRVYKNG